MPGPRGETCLAPTTGYRPPAISADTAPANRKRTLQRGIEWLPGMDSNHDSRLQRPLSCR